MSCVVCHARVLLVPTLHARLALVQELERQEEGEEDEVPVPTNLLLVPTIAVEVRRKKKGNGA